MQEKNMHAKSREGRYDFNLIALKSRNGCRAVKINQATFLAEFRTHLVDPFFSKRAETQRMQPRATVPDSSNLIKRARTGDETAFGELVNFYQQRLIGYCHRMTGSGAEDLAQDIFIKFYLALDRFDVSKPIDPFLFRIAHNHCLDALKKKSIQTVALVKKDEDEKEIQIKDGKPNPEELIQKVEVQKAVNQALVSLPVLYRSALIMWHVEGLSYEEISESLNLPIGTIKARIHRGRELLQQKLRPFVFLNEGN